MVVIVVVTVAQNPVLQMAPLTPEFRKFAWLGRSHVKASALQAPQVTHASSLNFQGTLRITALLHTTYVCHALMLRGVTFQPP